MTAGTTTSGRYRRRNPMPALLLMVVLGLVAAFVWLKVVDETAEADAARCNVPTPPATVTSGAAAPTLGQVLGAGALDRTAPVPAGQALVRVVNASDQRGLAATVTEQLRELGFGQVAEPVNDLVYDQNLNCRAQIRFGQQGQSAARTLSLVEPCAELVRDDRADATVDLALGTSFDDIRPRTEGRKAIEALATWAEAHPEAQGGLQAGLVPDIDANLLTKAREASC